MCKGTYKLTRADAYRYWGSRQDFEAARGRRWQRKFSQYMATLTADVRSDLSRDIQSLLRQSGLSL
jgi:hypothetical protein